MMRSYISQPRRRDMARHLLLQPDECMSAEVGVADSTFEPMKRLRTAKVSRLWSLTFHSDVIRFGRFFPRIVVCDFSRIGNCLTRGWMDRPRTQSRGLSITGRLPSIRSSSALSSRRSNVLQNRRMKVSIYLDAIATP